MFRPYAIAIFFGLAAITQPVLAQQPICDNMLPEIEDNAVAPGRILSREARVHFYESRSDTKKICPTEADACKRKGFLVSGDDILIGPAFGRFFCVGYIAPSARKVKGKFPETTGFVLAKDVERLPPLESKAADWLGTWSRAAEAEITITQVAGGKLRFKGEASLGALDEERAKRGAVRTGEFEGEAAPKWGAVGIGPKGFSAEKPFGKEQDECKVKLRQLGRYLAVEDNGACGGMGVTFSGIYVRLK
ncbi:MAG: hypothetical protein FD175_947 [Beijerinckiaceae bacterium]|nr:MAG: hypothetical protein FD175_947 [Beijerinckiaceae bacterium]